MASTEELLKEWYARVATIQRAHHFSIEHFETRSRWFGIPTVVLTTIVGTSVFASLGSNLGKWQQILVGLMSIAAAVLASLQTFLSYAERAEKHRSAAAKYGAIGRELETLLATPQTIGDEGIADIRKRLDALALESLNTPIAIYRRASESWEAKK